MECQRLGCARVRTSFRDWAGFAAILLIGQFFAVAAPLRAQNTPPSAPDPFGGLQRRLDTAADDQVALAKDTPLLTSSSVPRSVAVTQSTDAAPWHDSSGFLALRRADLGERRVKSLGIDARRILAEEGVPVELLGVARVESNFNPFAVSPKGAAGLWQFMPATARRYGLRVDTFQDDRFDVNKSTRAAGRYLRDLYAQFGNWPLALAAYNAGEDAVQRAIDRTSTPNFDAIARSGLLPAETRAYVPAVLKTIGSIVGERNAPKLPVGID
jgi:soluble lytic murein transglycosylase-like protein